MQQTIHVNPESDLGRQLKEAAADRKPLRLVSGGTIYAVEIREQEATPAAAQAYDPARARRALARSAGALRGVDLATLKRDVQDARRQEGTGQTD